jgi:predicted HAD superfamily Cof-like phosphohydrolase
MNYQGLETTKAWFEAAIPEPTVEQTCIQIGCHYEEVGEMLAVTGDDCAFDEVNKIANEYKKCNEFYSKAIVALGYSDQDRAELLDSLADQIVTAVGVAHMLGMDILGALGEVNRSNFSKFEDGKPVFDVNGKITKGKHYSRPDLTKFIGGTND